MKKVCHVTSVHPKEDVRIFRKECVSLARAGYDVTLVQQGTDDEKEGVHLVGFGEIAPSRLKRMLLTAKAAYRKALAVDADVYHLHDPELLPYALKLKKAGKTVIFDSHEDVPADISEKYWIPGFLRGFISKVYTRYEARCLARLDGVVGVTPHLCERLRRANPHTEQVTNYPVWEDLPPRTQTPKPQVVFPGLISELWCIDTLVQAVELVEGVTLELRSGNEEHPYFETLTELPGWKNVNYPGKVSHDAVLKLMGESLCGAALLHPCPNSGGMLGTLGNTKLFEYMMAGIPVVCTGFTLWREIMEQYHCGICVDPENAEEIAAAIRSLLDHPDEARQMGENGRKAVKEQFNWEREERKLLAFYAELT